MTTEKMMVAKIQADLPPGWCLVEYSELNHHITLIDSLGRTVRLEAEHVVKYTCTGCKEEIFARSNYGQIKCQCGSRMIPVWGEAQLCFIPKDETRDEDTEPGV